jgi:D-3-phosphoglycerate dehydrogenase
VLVKEKIGDSGVALLREHFDVDLGIDWSEEELAERIGAYEGIVIRSATKMNAELIERASSLRAIGRAGVGVDNVDVEAATKRGIVVANAPESNVVTAAEHTMALLLALARNIPQAYASLTAGKWERSKFSGVELYEKTLGILGFGRIGQLVAQRARGFGMRVLAFDPFVSAERYRDLGVEKADGPADIYAQADFITVHLPKTPETEGFLDAGAFAQMRDGARVLTVARGGLIDEAALKDALDSGKLAGAALDVTAKEPLPPESPLWELENVIISPHTAALSWHENERIVELFAENLRRYLRGDELLSRVDTSLFY